ncbi:hypothetical protein HKD37_11G032093 [Glycine soja]
MDEDQWMYDSVMSEEVDMNDQNEGEASVNEEHVDCFDAFNTSQDQYIHWHRLKDEDVVRDIFWSHPDAAKLTNAWMTFSAVFAYLEGERLNNTVWALQWFQGLFLKRDALPGVIVTDRHLALMNVVKTVFPDATNLLCRFHIDKNVKAKCKTPVGQKNTWNYVMEAWGSLVDCPFEQ